MASIHRYDTWLHSYATAVRGYRRPVIIGFGHEMYGPWYSWGYRRTPAATWVAAWRQHRGRVPGPGVGNVTSLWTINHTNPGVTGPLRDWWPGASYVTWGRDQRLLLPAQRLVPDAVFAPTIRQICRFTTKPILLSEVGVGQVAGQA